LKKCHTDARRKNMVQKAIDFATKVHEGQYRKGTDRPYIVHPMEVGKIVSTMTQDEEIISAAILHDTIEDCEGVDANVLKEMFSARVAYHRKAKINPRPGWKEKVQP
jgi:(p)ppGpp synthase/HD superfamily hydrolase